MDLSVKEFLLQQKDFFLNQKGIENFDELTETEKIALIYEFSQNQEVRIILEGYQLIANEDSDWIQLALAAASLLGSIFKSRASKKEKEAAEIEARRQAALIEEQKRREAEQKRQEEEKRRIANKQKADKEAKTLLYAGIGGGTLFLVLILILILK